MVWCDSFTIVLLIVAPVSRRGWSKPGWDGITRWVGVQGRWVKVTRDQDNTLRPVSVGSGLNTVCAEEGSVHLDWSLVGVVEVIFSRKQIILLKDSVLGSFYRHFQETTGRVQVGVSGGQGERVTSPCRDGIVGLWNV